MPTQFDPARPREAAVRSREVSACPVCGSGGRVVHSAVTDRAYGVAGVWQTMECRNCGSGWLNPAPLPEDLAACYVGDYYTHETAAAPTMGSSKAIAFLRGAVLGTQKGYRHLRPAGSMTGAAGLLLALVPPARRRASFQLGDMLLPFRAGGRLLEVGCGGGSYLALMKMLGWQVSGVEPDPVAAEVASRAAGCRVHVGTIDDAPFDAASFDAVVANHVIEHMADPGSFARAAARLLTPGGRVAVKTPNFQSLGHRLFGADLYSIDVPRHLCLFTPGSLRMLFEKTGLFRGVETSTPTGASDLAIHRRYAVRRTGGFLENVELGPAARGAKLLFRAAEACGNPVFHWGEEIQCNAIRA